MRQGLGYLTFFALFETGLDNVLESPLSRPITNGNLTLYCPAQLIGCRCGTRLLITVSINCSATASGGLMAAIEYLFSLQWDVSHRSMDSTARAVNPIKFSVFIPHRYHSKRGMSSTGDV
jgi:hypothetical protein